MIYSIIYHILSYINNIKRVCIIHHKIVFNIQISHAAIKKKINIL